MIRPVSGQAFLGAEPESSLPVLKGAPDRTGLDPIETRQGGPDIAIVARDTARGPDPQNPIRILPESGDGIILQAIFSSLVSRERPVGQSAETFVSADPDDTRRRREDL